MMSSRHTPTGRRDSLVPSYGDDRWRRSSNPALDPIDKNLGCEKIGHLTKCWIVLCAVALCYSNKVCNPREQ